ncbi:hypothetical protein ACNPQM_32640 [Streptomyces sp. NPDC056231]|uniref:hypothetical protein n=1 Tax=Streptomyces sp. NPDC056231 TaxID=3345755 RepID=UPI003AAFBD6A
MPRKHPLPPAAPNRLALRRGTVTLAALAALTLAAGTIAAAAPNARAVSTSGVAIATRNVTPSATATDSTDPVQYVQDSLYAAGDTGYLHRRANADGSAGAYTWRGYDGSERSLDTSGGALPGQYGYYASGSDTVLTSPLYSSGQIQMQDMAAGTTIDVTLPAGQYVAAVFGSTLITQELNEVWQVGRLHVLHVAENGAIQSDVPVDPPADQFFHRNQTVLAGDGRSALIRLRHATDIGLLDLTTGTITTISTHATDDDPLYLQAALSPTHIAVYHEGASQARVVRRDDPAGAQTVVPVPQYASGTAFVGLVGEWLLTSYRPPYGTPAGPGGPLQATPLNGGKPRTLLPVAEPEIAQIPSGGAVTVGQSTDGTWAAHRITIAPNGRPALTPLT